MQFRAVLRRSAAVDLQGDEGQEKTARSLTQATQLGESIFLSDPSAEAISLALGRRPASEWHEKVDRPDTFFSVIFFERVRVLLLFVAYG